MVVASPQLTEDIARRFVNSPAAFIRYHWPDAVLYHKQIEVAESVRDNVETFVHAGHKLGKDRVAAWIALWFFCTRQPARVIISSSSASQLEDTLFAEINEQIRIAAKNGRPLPVVMNHMLIRKPLPGSPGEFEALDYIVGKVVKHGESISGHHLDSSKGPRVLVILSEASGIDDVVYESAGTQRHRMLITGNPLTDTGFFADMCLAGDEDHPAGKQYGLLRKIVHIDGERDSPNVIYGRRWVDEGYEGLPATILPGVLSYIEYLERMRWPLDERRMRLHGFFPSQGDSRLFNLNMLAMAQELCAKIAAQGRELKRGRRVLGVDVAQGGDLTAWTVLDRFGVVFKDRLKTPDTSVIPGRTLRLMDKYKIAPEDVMFDSGGGGENEANHLRAKGYEVGSISFGAASAMPEAYRNMRSELYGEAAKMMLVDSKVLAMQAKPCIDWLRAWCFICIEPDDAMLKQDLMILPRATDGEGRLRLPPKDRNNKVQGSKEKTIRELLGRSPDAGDSFVLACYAYRRMRLRRQQTYVDRPMAY